MTNRLPGLAAAALLAMSMVPVSNVASAMPIADVLALKNAAPTNIETVQFRRRGFGRGIGFGAGVLGGAIIGGMLGNPYYYGPGPYYPGPGYVVPLPGNAVAYCMQRYRSYDPGSGTYLGYDGYRHPCP
jgi:BA14K-like protein